MGGHPQCLTNREDGHRDHHDVDTVGESWCVESDLDPDRVRAAQELGMSRATIYRKIHDYGIIAPSSSIR